MFRLRNLIQRQIVQYLHSEAEDMLNFPLLNRFFESTWHTQPTVELLSPLLAEIADQMKFTLVFSKSETEM